MTQMTVNRWEIFEAEIPGPSAAVDRMTDDQSYFLFYFGFNRPSSRRFRFDNGFKYRAEVIDTWEITVTDAGVYEGVFEIALPGKEYMAIRLIRV